VAFTEIIGLEEFLNVMSFERAANGLDFLGMSE